MNSHSWVRIMTLPPVFVALGTSIFIIVKAYNSLPVMHRSGNSSESRVSKEWEILEKAYYDNWGVSDKDLKDSLHENVDNTIDFCDGVRGLLSKGETLDTVKLYRAVHKALGVEKNILNLGEKELNLNASSFCLAVQEDLSAKSNVDVSEFYTAIQGTLNVNSKKSAHEFCLTLQEALGIKNSVDSDKFCVAIQSALVRWSIDRHKENIKNGWKNMIG